MKKKYGVRISSPESIPFIKMAAFDVSNKIMTVLAECGANAVIGNWVKARSIGVRNGIDFQSSGNVEKLKTDILDKVLEDEMIPIFPNIGWSAKGQPYNLSSNELAYTISVALKASKLFFLTNGKKLKASSFQIPEGTPLGEDGTITQINLNNVQKFITLNHNSEESLLDLLKIAYRACAEGVKRVHILDGTSEGMLLKEIFSNRGLGTMIYSNQHENIRPMTSRDIPEVLSILQPAIENEILVPRTASDLEENVENYHVYEVDGTIHACGALHLFDNTQGELAAIMVDKSYSGLGIGRRIINYLIDLATAKRLRSVFVLTTHTSDWFMELGFTSTTLDVLPKKRQKSYDQKRNSRIYIKQLM